MKISARVLVAYVELDALDPALAPRAQNGLDEPSSEAGAACAPDQPHAESADMTKPFELKPHDVAPAD